MKKMLFWQYRTVIQFCGLHRFRSKETVLASLILVIKEGFFHWCQNVQDSHQRIGRARYPYMMFWKFVTFLLKSFHIFKLNGFLQQFAVQGRNQTQIYNFNAEFRILVRLGWNFWRRNKGIFSKLEGKCTILVIYYAGTTTCWTWVSRTTPSGAWCRCTARCGSATATASRQGWK